MTVHFVRLSVAFYIKYYESMQSQTYFYIQNILDSNEGLPNNDTI